jgi:organic hydroperoxide reductase OsmC/OhrA
MQPLPHRYNVTVTSSPTAHIEITSPGLSPFVSAPPPEFDGPGNLWSPETLLVAAAADCLALTFRAIAKMSKLKWTSLVCDASGTLDRADGLTRFTGIHLRVRLEVPDAVDIEKARTILEKTEKACLVGHSLKFQPTLEAEITVDESVAEIVQPVL